MRNYFVALLLVFIVIGCRVNTFHKTEESKKEPFDHLFFSRAYPDNVLSISEVDKVSAAINNEIRSSDKILDTALWRLEGPTNIGGRINTIAVDPTNQNTIFIGNSSGGIFKTEDGGSNWNAIGDNFSYLSIGAIAIAPSNHLVVYAGTGDPNISGLPHVGNGIYKSIDGGNTWEHKGLVLPRIVSRIVIDPMDENIVYAATMGLPFERNDNRGLYKSTDGGDSWQQILFVSDEAGITDVVIDPDNPLILYAASWTRIRNNTESLVSGEDAHIFKSSDGGSSWSMLTTGLPSGEQGRIGLAIAQTNPNVLYSIWIDVDSQIGGVFKSMDGGENWFEIILPPEMDNALGGFGWYFGQIRVNPYNENEVSILGVDLYTSFNGGSSWEMTAPIWYTYEVHADKHDLVYVDQNTMLLATDGGLYKTQNHFDSWEDNDNIPNTQFYRVAFNPHQSGVYTGGAQDNGTTTGNFLGLDSWVRDYGGDGFQPLFDPENVDIRYAETQNGNIVRYDGFSWDSFTDGIDSEDRVNWDAPLLMSPHNSNTLYTGTYRVYRNDNGVWNPISSDLTDGNIYGDRYHTISTIDESPIMEGLLLAGTTDGNVHRSLDGGLSWNAISESLPDRYVTCVKTSPNNPDVVFVTNSGYKDNDNTTHIHRSDNLGDTWNDISGDLIEQPVNDIEILNDSVYFIATDFGVYYTENSGNHWQRVGSNMPAIPVFDLVIDTLENRLIAGTFARSIQSIDLSLLLTENIDTNVLDQDNLIVDVFPNPSTNQLNIQGIKGNWKTTILDLHGKVLFQMNYSTPIANIDVSKFSSGNYLLVLEVQGVSKSQLIIIE